MFFYLFENLRRGIFIIINKLVVFIKIYLSEMSYNKICFNFN